MEKGEARKIADEVLFQASCQLRQHNPEAYGDLLEWADVLEEAVPRSYELSANSTFSASGIIAEKSKI